MTPAPDAASQDAERQKRGQMLFMTGIALVFGGMILGGGLALVFYFLQQRPAAMIAGGLGAVALAAGLWLQVTGARMLKGKLS